jgi:hypothetical protein
MALATDSQVDHFASSARNAGRREMCDNFAHEK